jgi:hypothetical protein
MRNAGSTWPKLKLLRSLTNVTPRKQWLPNSTLLRDRMPLSFYCSVGPSDIGRIERPEGCRGQMVVSCSRAVRTSSRFSTPVAAGCTVPISGAGSIINEEWALFRSHPHARRCKGPRQRHTRPPKRRAHRGRSLFLVECLAPLWWETEA